MRYKNFPRLRKFLLCGIAALCTMAFAPLAYASSLSVKPLFLEVTPGQSAAIRVDNKSDAVQSIEVFVHERMVDENGIQTRVEADDDFIVFPPQAAVKATGTQVFRLQPIDPNASKSKSYYVTIRQLPVDLEPTEGGGAQIQVVFAFDSAVHVVPRGSKAEPEVMSASMDRRDVILETGEFKVDEDGSKTAVTATVNVPAVAVTLSNEGEKYLYLQDLRYLVTGTDAEGNDLDFPSWTMNELIKHLGVTLVKPGEKRNFKLPLPESFPEAKSIAVRVKERSRQ